MPNTADVGGKPLLFAGAALVAAAVVVGWLFSDSLGKMWQVWTEREEYSHGFLIPLVVGFLIWQRHPEIRRHELKGSWVGFALVVCAALMHLVGQVSSIFTVSQLAFVICVIGLALAFMGWAAFKPVLVPFLMLFFMVPFPYFLLHNISGEMQLLSSQLGVWVIEQFGIAVFLEGNVIHLANYRLQVAEACDGLRYMFPLMTLGFVMAYFFHVATWKRALLFLSSIPITIGMNSFRIGTIGVMVEHWGVGMAEGFIHDFQGWVIFMLCAGIMLLEMILLSRAGREKRPWREAFGIELPVADRSRPMVMKGIPASFYVSFLGLCLITAASLTIPRRAEAVPDRVSFVDFPSQLEYWSGRKQGLEPIYLEALKLDDYLLADYTRDEDLPVNLYVAWYDSQRAGRSAHSPRSCLPGGGWQIKSFSRVTVPGLNVAEVPLRANRVLIQLGSHKQLIYYWFQQRGRIVTNEYMVKWYILWDSLFRNRTDGALVRVAVPLDRSRTIPRAERELNEFMRIAVPRLTRYVPN